MRTSRRATIHPVPPAGAIAVLVEDPDLALTIDEADRPLAERAVVVPGFHVDRGGWEPETLAAEPHVGLLVLEGFVAMHVQLDDRIGSHLIGPGDVLAGLAAPGGELPVDVTYTVVERLRVALLGRRFLASVRRWPELLVALHERLRGQEQRLIVHAALGRLRRNEDRVLAALWHIAASWGRVGVDGVALPLALTHETIGRLAGAERPTVSLALAALAENGDLERRDDGVIVLDRASSARLGAAGPRFTRPRPPAPAARVGPPTTAAERRALLARVAALRQDLPSRIQGVDEVIAASREAAADSRELRARRQDAGPAPS